MKATVTMIPSRSNMGRNSSNIARLPLCTFSLIVPCLKTVHVKEQNEIYSENTGNPRFLWYTFGNEVILMMKKIAIIQMNIVLGDPEANRKAAAEKIKEAAENGSSVIVLPELWTTGYDLSRFDELAETMSGPTHLLMKEMACDYEVTIMGSVAEREDDVFYNTFVAYDPW